MERFRFQGRSTRLMFWRAMLGANLLAAIAWVITIVGTIYFGQLGMIALLGMAPALLWSVAAGVRRLHDLNRPGAWLLLFWGVPILAGLASDVFSSASTQNAFVLALGTACLGFLVWLWALVDLGFRRGDGLANRYGPPVGEGRKTISPSGPESLRSALEAGFD